MISNAIKRLEVDMNTYRILYQLTSLREFRNNVFRHITNSLCTKIAKTVALNTKHRRMSQPSDDQNFFVVERSRVQMPARK